MQKARLNIQLFGSGIIDGSSTASNCDCRIVWSSAKNDSNNSSLVEMTTQIKKSGSSSTTGTFSGVNIIDGTEFSVSKKTTWAWGDWRTVATSSKTVKHNDDGTKQISISTLLTQTGTSMAGTYRASGTITLDTINRASKLQSISNFDLNDTVIIGINKYVTSAVDTLQIKIGDTLIREVTNIANGYELTFSDTEKTTINSLATNPQVSLIFLLTTVNGGTTLGTSTQSVLVTLLDKLMFREIYQKENGKYQVAINGFVNTSGEVLQAYDDSGNLVTPNAYSLSEIRIGTWIDGRPIYRKVIPFNFSSSTNSVDIKHGISNIDNVIKAYGFINNPGEARFIPQIYYTMESAYSVTLYTVTATTFSVFYGDWTKGRANTLHPVAILEYTKSTDSPQTKGGA